MKITLLLCLSLVMFSGCTTNFPRLTEPNQRYRQALEERVGADLARAEADEALARVMNLFRDFSRDNLAENTAKVYAETFFFRDGFKEIHELDELEAYMVHSTEPVRTCTFDFAEPIRSGRDFYLKWTMNLALKSDREDEVNRAIGMSHLRFNEEGRVIFQQDYWDPTDILYRRIPVARGLIGYVRSKL